MLGLKETLDRIAKANGVRWYGYVIRGDDNNIVKKAMMLEVNGKRKQGRPKMTRRKQVEESVEKVGLKIEEAADRTRWREDARAIAEWMRCIRKELAMMRNANKLTTNYKKSCFMLVGNKQAVASDFNLCIYHVKIEQFDNVEYLSIHLDSKLTWKIHIEKLSCKLSQVCGNIYKLRHYVSLSTFKLFYYAMYHLHPHTPYLTRVEPAKAITIS